MQIGATTSFLGSLLDALTQHIAVIDERGDIVWVNQAWKTFAEANGGAEDRALPNANYLFVCRDAAADGDRDAAAALSGITDVIENRRGTFRHEYPCHSPTEKRWFMMIARRIEWDGPRRLVICHENITQRKLAEEATREMAFRDGLTGVANRRRFDEFLEREWRRAGRLQHPISLLMIDIDEFKLYNDAFGHAAGDDCLKSVAETVQSFARRPGDLAARFGGEEFALVLGETGLKDATAIADELRRAIVDLGIPHAAGAVSPHVTASLGLASAVPGRDATLSRLVEAADGRLYEAKEGGRNRLCIAAEERP